MKQEKTFGQKRKTFSMVGKWLVCLACTPVIIGYYLATLSGFALVSIIGVIFSDWTVLYPTNWANQTYTTRENRNQIREFKSTTFWCVFALAAYMILNAGLCVLVARVENANSDTKKAKIEMAKAAASAKNWKVGNRIMKAAGEATDYEKQIVEYIPKWYMYLGMPILLPLLSLFVFGIIYHKANEIEDDDFTEWANEQEAAPMTTAPARFVSPSPLQTTTANGETKKDRQFPPGFARRRRNLGDPKA